jgi:hypothetical protein
MNTRVSNNYKEVDTNVKPKSLIKRTREVEDVSSRPLKPSSNKILKQFALKALTILKDKSIAFGPKNP